MSDPIKIIECPRDAMQGFPKIIATQDKIAYIKTLLDVGFDVLDFGSFVSAKAIPQMWDTNLVCQALEEYSGSTKLLAIVANKRGAEEAAQYSHIHYLGYPFSISESFQLRNTNSTIEESVVRVQEILDISLKNNKELIIYISMAFGNPYGDLWNSDIVSKYVDELRNLGVKTMALSDTIGVATPESIQYLFKVIIQAYPDLEIGAHFHSTYDTCIEKLEAAYNAGCLRFDGAVKGLGGCPMAKDELVGNMATESILQFGIDQNIKMNINIEKFWEAYKMSETIFTK